MQLNVLMSQGWCAALGVPVPTPFFVQEYLLGNYNDRDRAFHFLPSLIKLLLTLEVSDMDRRFHDNIMGESGKWWLSSFERPLLFMVLWHKLENRTDDVGGNYIHRINCLIDLAARKGGALIRKTMGAISIWQTWSDSRSCCLYGRVDYKINGEQSRERKETTTQKKIKGKTQSHDIATR